MRLKILLFLMLVSNALCIKSMNNSSYISLGVTALGIGSLTWQHYMQDFSIKKSLLSGTLLATGLASLLYTHGFCAKLLRICTRLTTARDKQIGIYLLTNDYKKIEDLLSNDVIEPNSIRLRHQDLLIFAIENKRVQLCRLCFEKGQVIQDYHIKRCLQMSDINKPICLTRFKKRRKILEFLLQNYNQDLNNFQDYDGSVLHHILNNSRDVTPKIVEILLNKGVNIEGKDSSGRTPLFLAIEKNFPNIVDLLLKKGANADTKDDKGELPTKNSVMFMKAKVEYAIYKEHNELYNKHFKEKEGNVQDTYLRKLPNEIAVNVISLVVNNERKSKKIDRIN